MRLDPILEYEMDELEAKAFKVCLMWLDHSKKLFPDYQHTKMKKGDPRKSLIFKICYKLVRETQGLIKDEDYILYVRAQLEVLKYVNGNKTLPLIDPNCLVGEKAWKRWKLWKKKYDALSAKPNDASTFSKTPGIAKAINGLEQTLEFIVKTMGANPTLEKYQEAKTNNNLLRWINLNKISPYYLVVSPYIAKIMSDEDFQKINFDPAFYLECIDDTVKNKFKELFGYEYQ